MSFSTPEELEHLLPGADPAGDPSQEAAGEGRVGSHWQGPVRLLRGEAPVVRMAAQLFAEARRELLLFMAPPLLADPVAWEAYLALRARQVPTRQVLDAAFLEGDDQGSQSYVERFARDLRTQGRRHEKLPGKLIVVDRRVALVSINRLPGVEHQALCVHHRGLLLHLLASFEQHWDAGRPLDL